MKRTSSVFLIAALLLLLHYSRAIEHEEKGAVVAAEEKGNSNSTTAELSNVGEEKKSEKEKALEKPKVEEKSDKVVAAGEAHVEECDPSNRCIEEKSKFIACLRVPGKDSLDLSLLIQNKGIGSLDVNILAPDFVNLELATVQLKAKENKEVKVSVGDGGNNTVIVLRAGDGNCSLDFRNMISVPTKKSENSALSRYLSRLSTRTSLLVIFLAAAVLVSLAWLYIRFRWMNCKEDGTRYQKAEVGLPVSTGGKKEASEPDGWDNSWEDEWDDEEAPMTPSKPVLTPSAKGLASRRFNKDSWKD